MTDLAVLDTPTPGGQDLQRAVGELARLVESQRAGDQAYFINQLPRYVRTIERIHSMAPAPRRVLDIGSHYLHQSMLLSAMGYQVTGIDVDVFAAAAFVKTRAQVFGIRNVVVNSLEAGAFLPPGEPPFDVIVFTEILEHITFNPVRFWARVYELLASDGIIFVSTPNSMRPGAWLRQLRDLMLFRGIGQSLQGVMSNVTYGHHWKEYSAWEVRRYFELLSADFRVTTRWYSSESRADRGWKHRVKSFVATVPCWRSDIEALVRRTGNAGFSARAPSLPMHTAPADRIDAGRATTEAG